MLQQDKLRLLCKRADLFNDRFVYFLFLQHIPLYFVGFHSLLDCVLIGLALLFVGVMVYEFFQIRRDMKQLEKLSH